jgi:hypothetical protein
LASVVIVTHRLWTDSYSMMWFRQVIEVVFGDLCWHAQKSSQQPNFFMLQCCRWNWLHVNGKQIIVLRGWHAWNVWINYMYILHDPALQMKSNASILHISHRYRLAYLLFWEADTYTSKVWLKRRIFRQLLELTAFVGMRHNRRGGTWKKCIHTYSGNTHDIVWYWYR